MGLRFKLTISLCCVLMKLHIRVRFFNPLENIKFLASLNPFTHSVTHE